MTKAVPQSETVDTDRLQGGEKAHFWRRNDYDNLECLSANFTDHQYDLHTHDTFAFGVITAGAERFMCDGREYVAKPGQLCLVHPGQVHDGGPADSGFTYRMFYPSVSLLTDRAYELRDGRDDMPTFANPVIDDPVLADIAVELHKRLEAQPDSMAIDQALEQMLAMLIDRQMATEDWQASFNPDKASRTARAYMDANFADDIGLDDLAQATGVSRYQILRRFKTAYGFTPHAYLIDCRVRAARKRLAAGEAPADVATDCGFYDQSHLNRAFKARVGVTPARYRAL